MRASISEGRWHDACVRIAIEGRRGARHTLYVSSGANLETNLNLASRELHSYIIYVFKLRRICLAASD